MAAIASVPTTPNFNLNDNNANEATLVARLNAVEAHLAAGGIQHPFHLNV
jgi:hypothetical protein